MNVRRLAATVSYFTVFPVADRDRAPPTAAMFGYLPLIGILIGGLAGFAAYGVSLLGVAPLAVAAAFALPIAFTGALHVDGFLDSCDALFASVDPQRRLAIMKDPHHGSFAIAYFALLCVVWLAALVALPAHAYPGALAFAGGTARWAAALNGRRYPYADGGRPATLVLFVGALLVLALSFAVGRWGWIAVPLLALFTIAAGRWASGRLGGKLTGDVHGALIVAGEVVTLALCALFYGR